MRKLLFVCAMALCLALALSPAVFAEEAAYEERSVKVVREGSEDGELPLRFYEDTPNIPYIGIGVYSQYVSGQPITVRENGDGTCALVNWNGEEISCDADAGVITVPDWGRFFDLPLPLEDKALGWKDTATRFARITDVVYEGEPTPVILDFYNYGISIYADQDDVYLPVSTLTNIMTDIATNYMAFNGEKLFVQRLDLEGKPIKGFYDSKAYVDMINGQERPADVVKQCYADLCFSFDHLYGFPGRSAFEDALAEKGLDQALTDLGEEGAAIKAGLLSSDLTEYVLSNNKLFAHCLFEGHTTYFGTTSLSYIQDDSIDKMYTLQLSAKAIEDMTSCPMMMSQIMSIAIPIQRSLDWGGEKYREYGNTAILRLDSFMPDEEAWSKYYSGEGDFPEDDLGNVISGLRKASENPEIENVIIDLTGNGGGSPDVMMAILAVTTGQTQLYGLHKLTGQRITFTFEADANFDGVYDEKDKEIKYDFNYGVLTSRHAFSCGNLFPVIAQEGGAVLIGERTGGGSCCVQIGTDIQGFSYMMSSGQWQLTDSNFHDVEAGCNVDVPIETPSIIDGRIMEMLIGLDEDLADHKNYYDDALLDQIMNDWYANQAEVKLAA